MRIRDRNTWPTGGWIFYQPETNWWAPDPMSNSFNSQVTNIIGHRSKNPRFNLSTDRTVVENDLDQYTCARLGNNPQWCMGKGAFANESDAQKKTGTTIHNPKPEGLVARLAARSRQIRDGERIIASWLGDSMAPVSQSLADDRAMACLSCPLHDSGNWFDHFTGSIAEAVLDIARVKTTLGLVSTNESGLGTCKACGCHLATKVWIPLRHIKENTSDEILNELHAKCWIKTES